MVASREFYFWRNIMKIIATTRQAQGTGASRRLRRADKLPGIVYGGILRFA